MSAAGVRVADWTFTLLALAGVAVSLITGLDAWEDLRVRARAGKNGDLATSGRIARRGAFASMLLHAGFLALGVTAVMAPLPSSARYGRAEFAAVIFIVVQAGVVAAQIRNQFDRSALRRA